MQPSFELAIYCLAPMLLCLFFVDLFRKKHQSQKSFLFKRLKTLSAIHNRRCIATERLRDLVLLSRHPVQKEIHSEIIEVNVILSRVNRELSSIRNLLDTQRIRTLQNAERKIELLEMKVSCSDICSTKSKAAQLSNWRNTVDRRLYNVNSDLLKATWLSTKLNNLAGKRILKIDGEL